MTYLKKADLLRTAGRGRFRLTERGRDFLANEQPTAIDVKFLKSRFPGANAAAESPAIFNAVDGTWVFREGVEERIRERMTRSIPVESTRRAALELLAYTIENADEERADAWCVRETGHGLALTAGRMLACKVTRSKARVGIVGPVSDEVRTAVGAEPEDDEEFKSLPGAILLTFPVEHAEKALGLLKDEINSFVDLAMARVRRAVSLESHVPEAVAYVASVVGRELPQPEQVLQPPDEEEDDDLAEDGDAVPSREPRIRGRAPIFEQSGRAIASLMSDIESGAIALPDLQRPFVWEQDHHRVSSA